MPKAVSTEPVMIAALYWIDEAERKERPLPEWVLAMRDQLAQQPPRRSPPRVTAWASVGRPSAN